MTLGCKKHRKQHGVARKTGRRNSALFFLFIFLSLNALMMIYVPTSPCLFKGYRCHIANKIIKKIEHTLYFVSLFKKKSIIYGSI